MSYHTTRICETETSTAVKGAKMAAPLPLFFLLWFVFPHFSGQFSFIELNHYNSLREQRKEREHFGY